MVHHHHSKGIGHNCPPGTSSTSISCYLLLACFLIISICSILLFVQSLVFCRFLIARCFLQTSLILCADFHINLPSPMSALLCCIPPSGSLLPPLQLSLLRFDCIQFVSLQSNFNHLHHSLYHFISCSSE